MKQVISEKRRGYFIGLAPGEWLSLIVVVSSVVYGYGVLASDVRTNSNDISGVKKHTGEVTKFLINQIRESETRTTVMVQQSEQRVREDIRELRELIIKGR